MSPTWQAPAAGRHTLPAGCLASAGLLGLGRSQHSAWLSARAADVHSVAVWPAGCWHVSLVPLQVSAVHGLPSSVHAVPLACLASARSEERRVGKECGSWQSPTASRQIV